MNNADSEKKIVFVGLSGGVDSSVSAYLLKKAGYDVVGVYLKTWQPDFVECTWRDEKRDAMRVAAHLDIPFVFMDVAKEYETQVANKMIEEYKAGRTPNPDVLCNKDIKFGIFLREAIRLGADYIATGHYAQVQHGSVSKLSRGVDASKDQAYFLWTLTQEQLSKTLFPVGGMKKSTVRAIAKKAGLPTAEKKDSQGICFIGPIDMKEFLSHYIEKKEGSVLDQNGKIIGAHIGSALYTIGERHGFTLFSNTPSQEPLYIIAKNIEKNTITVAPRESTISKKDSTISILETNWISGMPEVGKKYTAEIRYHGEPTICTVHSITANAAEVSLETSEPIASGQSLVLYDGTTCLGGGVAA